MVMVMLDYCEKMIVLNFFFVLFIIGYCGVLGYCFEYICFLYEIVFVLGVDVVEFDVVVIWDGVFVVWYENEILVIIDVVWYFEFVDWCIIKQIDGVSLSGWFIEDFMWVEFVILCVVEWLFQL